MLPTIRIFVSSPGDVYQERVAAERVIKRLRDRYASDAIIVPVMWEHEPLTASRGYQEQIDEQINVAECDVVVILLWARMGTRLPKSVAVDPQGNEYPSGTAYEFWTSFERYQQDGCPDILVYKKTSKFENEKDDAKYLKQVASQKESLEQFMAQLLSEEGLPKHAYLTFDDVRRFEETFEVHLEKLIERKLFGEVSLNPTWRGNPFLGLRAFDLQHAPVYFGRQVATQRAFDQLKNRAESGISSLLVVGASGSGKSSLVRSGLASRILSSHHELPYAVIRPGAASPDTPIGYLAQAIEEAIPAVKPFRLRELLERNPAAVPNVLSGIRESSGENLNANEPKLLLIVDQLEELLTLGFGADQQRMFATAIDLLSRSGVCWCIATLRSDYYARLTAIPEFSHFTESGGIFDLQPPTKAEIGQMIRRPARAAGLYFEEDRKTGQTLDDLIREDAGDHAEILPLLEFTLDELYMRRTENGQLTFEDYTKLGRIEGSVSRRADEVFRDLPADVQNSLSRVFRQLVTVSIEDAIPTRQRCNELQFADDPPARQLVDAFVEARLLSRDGKDGKPYVEIVHEALLKRWQPLFDWLRQEGDLLRMRSRLMESYQRWTANYRRSDLLLPQGKALEEAELVTEHADLLRGETGKLVSDYVKHSRTAVLRRRRYAIAAVAGLALLTILATGASISAVTRGNALQTLVVDLEASEKIKTSAILTGFAVLEAKYSGDTNEILSAVSEVENQLQTQAERSAADARVRVFQAVPLLLRLQKNTGDTESLTAKLKLLPDLKEFDRLLDEAITLDPSLGIAYLARGQLWSEILPLPLIEKSLLLVNGIAVPTLEEVSMDWENAVRLMPQSSYVFSGRGWWRMRTGELEIAKEDFQMAIQLDPNNDFALQGYANWMVKNERYQEAVELYLRAFRSPSRIGDVLFGNQSKGAIRNDIAVTTYNKLWDKKGISIKKIHPAATVRVYGQDVSELEFAMGYVWEYTLDEITNSEDPSREDLIGVLRSIDFPEGDAAYRATRGLLEAAVLAISNQKDRSQIERLCKESYPSSSNVWRGELDKDQLTILTTAIRKNSPADAPMAKVVLTLIERISKPPEN